MKRLIPAAMVLAGLAAAPTPPALAQAGSMQVSDAWARPTIPTRPGAGYFRLVNTGDEADVLVDARAEGAEKVEFHTVHDNLGVLEMLRLESLEIAPGEEVLFEPGGFHLMFMGLEEPLAEGDVFPATLVFEHAGEVQVEFDVGDEPQANAEEGEQGHGDSQ